MPRQAVGSDPQMPNLTGLPHSLEKAKIVITFRKDRFPVLATIDYMVPGIWILDAEGSRHEKE